jgi:signal transduction histidine kinase
MNAPAPKQKTSLAELARHILEAQDNKSENVARLLHDDLGQQVAAISILLSTLKRRLPPGDPETLEQFERALQKVVALGESLRTLSNEFHSSILEHAGIGVALRAHCSGLSSQPGIQISFESNGDFETVPFHVARGLFKIAQETLRDLAAASVRLSHTDGAVHLAIQSESFLSLPPKELATLRQRGKSIGATVRVKASQLTASTPRIC